MVLSLKVWIGLCQYGLSRDTSDCTIPLGTSQSLFLGLSSGSCQNLQGHLPLFSVLLVEVWLTGFLNPGWRKELRVSISIFFLITFFFFSTDSSHLHPNFATIHCISQYRDLTFTSPETINFYSSVLMGGDMGI